MRLNVKQITWLKGVLHLAGFLPFIWLFWAGQQGYFSADPAKDIQHFTGRMALKFLLATLLVSPLARYAKQPLLIRTRRLLGLWCFAWATLHLTSYTLLELGINNLALLGSELVSRPYLTLGFISWLILLALAATSTQALQRKLGRRWQTLHNFVYLVAILAPIHYLWSVKILSPQPVIYAVLGFYFSSVQVWVFALLSLGAWYGAETGYLSDWGNHFLGLNYPQRYVAFGGLLVACRFLLAGKKWFTTFDYSTYVVGMLYLFISLWFLSIFGNSESWIRWYSMKQVELWAWNLLILFGSVVAIFVGLKRDDAVARGFGITFFLLGIYTLYFSLLWDVMYAGLFFFILAVSFWLLGRKAEKVWNLEFLRDPKKLNDDMN